MSLKGVCVKLKYVRGINAAINAALMQQMWLSYFVFVFVIAFVFVLAAIISGFEWKCSSSLSVLASCGAGSLNVLVFVIVFVFVFVLAAISSGSVLASWVSWLLARQVWAAVNYRLGKKQ